MRNDEESKIADIYHIKGYQDLFKSFKIEIPKAKGLVLAAKHEPCAGEHEEKTYPDLGNVHVGIFKEDADAV